jgi:hypothetical protein
VSLRRESRFIEDTEGGRFLCFSDVGAILLKNSSLFFPLIRSNLVEIFRRVFGGNIISDKNIRRQLIVTFDLK